MLTRLWAWLRRVSPLTVAVEIRFATPGAAAPETDPRQLSLDLAPPSPGAPLLEASQALVNLVEGVGYRRWESNGYRLKDTPEWMAFYVATRR